VQELVAAIGTPVVPVVVPSNYSLMAMAFSPLEEVLKQMEAMLPVIMIALAVAVPEVRSVLKVVRSWHPVLSKPKEEMALLTPRVVVAASLSGQMAT
jgi:hypothetical protein